MRTQEQYLADLAKMRPNVYFHGEKLGRDDPRIVHAARAVCTTFALAESEEFSDLMTATSPARRSTASPISTRTWRI